MNAKSIREAVADAKKFIAAANKALDELGPMNTDRYLVGTSISGSCRRASMDLTRALAKMRKA